MLEYKNVSLASGGIKILENINLSFKKGKLTTVIGPNGCGKTTLLQALNGQSKILEGELLVEGEDISKFSPRERARKVSFLPQVHSTIPSISTETLVSHGRFPYLGFARKMGAEDKRIIREAMERADILEYEKAGVDALSGGVRQRAFIAMQLSQCCGLVIADEPTTYLDVPSRKKIFEIYEKLRDEGKTVVLVLHDIEKALEISDEIILMNERKIVFTGTPEELIGSGKAEETFGVKIKRCRDESGKEYLIAD